MKGDNISEKKIKDDATLIVKINGLHKPCFNLYNCDPEDAPEQFTGKKMSYCYIEKDESIKTKERAYKKEFTGTVVRKEKNRYTQIKY